MDPDPIHCNAYPEPDADPAPHQSEANSATTKVYRPSRAPWMSLYAPIVSVHGPPRLHFEPQQLLNFDFNAESDPDFHSNADVDPDPSCQNNADL
jgi:hypothetical protein